MSAQIERLDGTGDPAPRPLPQPGWRLLGVASIGIGSGLYTASAPPALLLFTLAVTAIALLVICIRTMVRLDADPVETKSKEAGHG